MFGGFSEFDGGHHGKATGGGIKFHGLPGAGSRGQGKRQKQEAEQIIFHDGWPGAARNLKWRTAHVNALPDGPGTAGSEASIGRREDFEGVKEGIGVGDGRIARAEDLDLIEAVADHKHAEFGGDEFGAGGEG